MTKGGRELQLDRRDKFFADPIFQDILSCDDKLLHRKLDLFKKKDASLALLGHQAEAAHNLQVTVSNDKFMIQLELPGFAPEDFSLKTRDDVIVLEANHNPTANGADHGTEFTERHYKKEFLMPEGVQPEGLRSSYSAQGILSIEAPRMLQVPEGAQMQEALAAKSKAYTTDDGRTNVSEKSQAASQVIAASTASPDGRTHSTMTYSTSSSSSSSMVTTGGGGGGGPGDFPSLPPMRGMSNFPQMQPMMPPMLDMDSMMQQMMGDMSLGSRMGGAGMHRMGGMLDQQQGGFGGFPSMMPPPMGMPQMPQMPQMPGFGAQQQQQQQYQHGAGQNRLDIEELQSPTGMDPFGNTSARYTVTSPPPSVASPTPSQNSDYDGITGKKRSSSSAKSPSSPLGGVRSHKVTAAPISSSSDTDSDSGISGVGFGFRSQKDPQADHTVLLKLREGSEYKLVLNMQEYPPENITVKLNDREITVLAHANRGSRGAPAKDDFVQRHLVPDGIDLDQLTSTFSADGILVIRAPRVRTSSTAPASAKWRK